MIRRPPPSSPIKLLERIWMYTACAYNCFDETIMADEDWDMMAKELDARREEWTPYFVHFLPTPEYPVQTTSMGIDWEANPMASLVRKMLGGLDGDYSSVIAQCNKRSHARD